jgi:hypothetical protein
MRGWSRSIRRTLGEAIIFLVVYENEVAVPEVRLETGTDNMGHRALQ